MPIESREPPPRAQARCGAQVYIGVGISYLRDAPRRARAPEYIDSLSAVPTVAALPAVQKCRQVKTRTSGCVSGLWIRLSRNFVILEVAMARQSREMKGCMFVCRGCGMFLSFGTMLTVFFYERMCFVG